MDAFSFMVVIDSNDGGLTSQVLSGNTVAQAQELIDRIERQYETLGYTLTITRLFLQEY